MTDTTFAKTQIFKRSKYTWVDVHSESGQYLMSSHTEDYYMLEWYDSMTSSWRYSMSGSAMECGKEIKLKYLECLTRLTIWHRPLTASCAKEFKPVDQKPLLCDEFKEQRKNEYQSAKRKAKKATSFFGLCSNIYQSLFKTNTNNFNQTTDEKHR